jgi:hypothetical protein
MKVIFYFLGKIHGHFLAYNLPPSQLGLSAGYCQRALVDDHNSDGENI